MFDSETDVLCAEEQEDICADSDCAESVLDKKPSREKFQE